MPRVPFVTQTAFEQSLAWSSQRLVNLYARPAPPGSRTEMGLLNTPGLLPWSSAGDGPIYAMVNGKNLGYCVSHYSLYQINYATGATTLLGAGDPLAGHYWTTMAANDVAVVVVMPPKAYVWDYATWTEITGQGMTDFGSVCAIDGYHVFSEGGDPNAGTGRFYVSDLRDPGTIGSLSFATAESAPDGLVRVFTIHGDLWLFGHRTTEIWENAGLPGGQPFQRQQGAVMQVGLAARNSPAIVDNGVCWLGHDLIVYRSRGTQPERISTHAIEAQISDYAGRDKAIGFGMQHDGHEQYVLTFPDANRTLVWDAATRRWHQRSSGGFDNRWRGQCALRSGDGSSRMLVGDATGGGIFELSKTALNDAGVSSPRLAMLPPLWARTRRSFMSRMELEMDGTGGAPAEVLMDYSDDGGATFDGLRVGSTVNAAGRVAFHRLGSFRQRILRFQFPTGPRLALFGVDVDAEIGDA